MQSQALELELQFSKPYRGKKTTPSLFATVLDTLEKAQRDKRIVGIYLDGTHSSSGNAGFATLKEVRTALERFRAAGKTILAYNMDWGQREYYLGSVANTIVLNPLGEMEVKGLSTVPMFMAGAFQKYGIGCPGRPGGEV